MKKFKITSVNNTLRDVIQRKIDCKTKPVGSLGLLEQVALQVGSIQNTASPRLSKPHLIVFAGDHGIAHEGVSAYPQEVTWQMVVNFLNGGAAINVFCRQHGIDMSIVDAGVNYDFPEETLGLTHSKAGMGTANFSKVHAMSMAQAAYCIDAGANLVKAIEARGCNVIGFGEMGIGNTSSAAVLMSVLCNLPIEQCVGRGTGVDDDSLHHKLDVLKRSLKQHGMPDTPLKALSTYGGFEIAHMVGAMLQSAECKLITLIDGFISTVAYLVASSIEPAIKDYCIFCHQSQERGHERLLYHLGVRPLLDLGMRLGEGTGVAIAYPIIQSAVNFINDMASFESAGIQQRSE